MHSNSIRTPQTCRGFTLVETLVAISVLVIAIIGPLYAVHKSVMASYAARDQLIATALAQEGVEYVRFIRDGNYLESFPNPPTAWLDGLQACISSNGCVIDPNQGSVSACATSSGGGCPALRRNEAATAGTPKLYLQTTNSAYTPTRFTRKVVITTISPTEVAVDVTVSWSTQRVPYSITVSEHLYNWL